MQATQVRYITIGRVFAEDMHYSHLIGCTAVILHELPSVVEVQVVGGGEARHIGETADIHIQDCKAQLPAIGSMYKVLVNHTMQAIYYTEDRALYAFALRRFEFHDKETFRAVSFMHQILDEYTESHPHQDWTMHLLGDETDPHLTQFHMLYRMDREAAQ